MAVEPSSSEGTSALPLSDEIIMGIAGQVPNGNYHDLGIKLGISWQESNNILEKHMKDIKLSATELLMSWKTKHGSGPAQRQELHSILVSAGLGDLASRLVPVMALKLSERKITLEECRASLDAKYKSAKIQLTPWDKNARTTFSDLHTRIAIHKEERRDRGLETKKIPVEGSINGIFKTKVNGKLPKRVVLLGDAGYGKSTSVQKMSHDWATRATECPFKDVLLLFALKFRKTDKKKSLGDAIKSQLLSSLPDVSPEEIERIIEEHEDSCLVLIDGYDEFNGSLRDNNSSLIKLILGERFRECRVLVTSRPNRKEDFTNIDLSDEVAIMEIEGFSTEDAKTYVDLFFQSDESYRTGFHKHMIENNISFLISIPFFCMSLCILWKDNFMKNARTLTQIFDCLFNYLSHHAQSRGLFVELSKKILKEKLDLSKEAVGKVAFEFLVKDSQKLLFDEGDFLKTKHTDFAIQVGILKEERFMIKRGEEKTKIEFFHKFAQEYCAGGYFASLERENQNAILKTIKNKDEVLQLENVFRFAVGFSKQTLIPIMEHICSMKWETKYGYTSIKNHLANSNLTRLVLDFLSEITSDAADQPTNPEERLLAEILHPHFSQKSLHIENVNVNTIYGLNMVPEKTKSEIIGISIESTSLDEAVCARLWSCLASFSSLTHLTIINSSLPLPAQPPPIPSVQRLDADHLTSESYSGLIGSLSGLKGIVVCLKHAERDISQIAAGLERSGGEGVTDIVLNGWGAVDGTVSAACMSRLVKALRRTNRLQKIELLSLIIDAESLVTLVEQCRCISTMTQINIYDCGVRDSGRLHSHLRDLHHPEGAIEVRVHWIGYKIPHAGR